MGDQAENSRALEDVLGAVHRLHTDEWSPKVLAGPSAFSRYDVATAGLWVRYPWRGFALRRAVEGGNTNALASWTDVQFGSQRPADVAVTSDGYPDTDVGNDGGYVRLRCGDMVEVPRGFDGVWVRCQHEFTQTLEVVHDPMFSLRQAQPIVAPMPLLTTEVPWSSTTGNVVAPALGAVIADTGPFAATARGWYDIDLALSADGTSTAPTAQLEHRNAANAANLWRQSFIINAAAAASSSIRRGPVFINTSERIRVIIDAASAAVPSAAKTYSVTIFYRRTI